MPCVSSSPARRSPGSILLSRQIQGACSKPPCESHVSPEQCWGNAPAGTTTFQRTCHGSFPFPEHGFSRETSWSLGLQALLCSAGNVPVPPRGSATFFRRNHRPECGRHGVWASLVLALALSPLSRHVDRHFYRHFYRRWALAIKLALKLALNDGRRSVVDRGPGPRQGQAGRRERRRPAEASPLCQVRVWTTLFGKFTVGAWERQAPTRGAPSGTRPPAGRGGPGPFTRCAVPALARGRQP